MKFFTKILKIITGADELEKIESNRDKEILNNKISSLENRINDLTKKIESDSLVKVNIDTPKNKIKTLTNNIENNNLVIFEDREKIKLKLEISNLEEELENLSEKKNEYINKLNDFNTKYTIELGEVTEILLGVKKELLEKQVKNNNFKDENLNEEFEDIKEEYESFHNQYNETLKREKNKGFINSDDLKELKKIFRKTVKICHPDIVDERYKAEAHEIFIKLNDAYQRKMLDEVLEIYESLENNNFNDSGNFISEIDSFKQRVKYLKKAIYDTNIEIENIINSDEYLMFDEIDDFDKYLKELKEEFYNEIEYIKQEISNIEDIEIIDDDLFEMEDSSYSKRLRDISYPTFNKIRQISVSYINNIDNSDEIFNDLDRGTKVLEDHVELYQYIHSYGKMHRAKLYNSFDVVMEQINYKNINLIDWGCGQALASSLLIDYIKDKELDIILSDIILIEPSQIALSRGLLHIDILKDYDIDVKAINKGFDDLVENDLKFNNSNITLHLFSNILDVEYFKLDREFLEKISNSQNGVNYFICVSPNIGNKRNNRIDIFYEYFKDNFRSELISHRDCNINNYKRYEKIFKVEI